VFLLAGHNQAEMARGWLDVIKPKWLLASWTQSSRAASRLAGDDGAGLAFGCLDAIEPKWLSAGWTLSSWAGSQYGQPSRPTAGDGSAVRVLARTDGTAQIRPSRLSL
jgi:hypothetical protein